MSDRTKTAHYRRCVLSDGQGIHSTDGKTLQDLVVEAVRSQPRPWLRALGVGAAAHQLLTATVTKNACTCGEIVYYEPDRKIPLVDINKDGSTWQDTIHPQDSTGTPRKFQERSLYFAIRENHVAIIQSISMQADDLQDFLTWFIQSKANLATGLFLSLANLPAKSARDKLKDHRIKGIKFGDRLFTSVRVEEPPDLQNKSKRKRFVQKLETSPTILNVLRSLGIAQPILDKLSENPDPGAIQVEVDISYRSRTEKEGLTVLNSLAATLGKQQGLETEIRLEGNSAIKGDELTISDPIKVQCPSGCIAVDDALAKLSRWLADQIKSGKVL